MHLGVWASLVLVISGLVSWPSPTECNLSLDEEIDLIASNLYDRRVLKQKLDVDQGNDLFIKDSINLELEVETCVFRTKRRRILDFQATVSRDLYVMNQCLAKWSNEGMVANWNYLTNLTDDNKQKADEEIIRTTEHTKQLSQLANMYIDDVRYAGLDWDSRRQLRLIGAETSPRKKSDNKRLIEISSRLESLYGSAKVGGLALEPSITTIMDKSRDAAQLQRLWVGWRDATGPAMKDLYTEMVDLMNEGARDNGYKNYAEAWMEEQFDETPGMEQLTANLWSELEPLYQQLHAFVRNRLSQLYRQDYPEIFDSGAIPAHLLGNMWAQQWQGIYDLVKPFPEVSEPDYDRLMKEQGYTVDKLFTMAEEFYTSIGLFPMTEKFKKYSMKERPSDGRQVVCHASAEDFMKDDDFRIKMCTEVNMDYFEVIHHEMGHIEYFMAYRKQPTIYRNGANSAFHEAVGDTIALSVNTPVHLKTVKLTSQSDGNVDEELERKRNINYLMKEALIKIAFLPFGYLIDKWRWDVFRGITPEQDYNKNWWYLRLKYQGIVPPVPRSDVDFDPGAKYHIPSNSPYICYFVSFIIQFQFYEAMCKEAGHQGELSTCDFYRSKAAGEKLLAALELGKSRPWQDAMEKLTGVRHISTASIRRYFEPLKQWLKAENELTRAKIGWEEAKVDWIED